MLHRFDRATRGFALPLAAIIVGIVFAFSSIVLDAVLSSRRAGKVLQNTLSASQIGEAGLHKAVACLNGSDNSKCGGTAGINYPGETAVTFGGGTFTTTVTGGASAKEVVAVGTVAGDSRTVIADLTTIPPTDAMGFSYALQTGSGGAQLENNSSISGTIYSSGDVECQSAAATITGDAYSSNVGGKIDGCTVGYHAHADNILDSEIGGDAYYLTSVAGSTVTGTEYSGQATPPEAALPEVDIEFWQDAAEEGGLYDGNYSPADNSTIGPLKVNGNLILDQNVDVTLAGPIWVKGNITTYNNSSLTLHSSFGAYSTVILADDPDDQATNGKITIVNNTGIYGSGNSLSHLLFVTTNTSTSDTSPALSVANNATGAIFYATNGTMRLQNNAGAKSLAGYRLFLDQNAVVTYVQSEFAGEFSSSPGTRWRIIDGSWREES